MTNAHETSSAHTPGPWHVDRESHHAPICIKPYPGRIVCDIDGTDAEAEANAQLIAAAPDLLDACVAALSQLTEERGEYRDSDTRQLKDALAKAGRRLKRYRVLVRSSELQETFVEAFSSVEARLKVEDMDDFGDVAREVPDHGEWLVEKVEEAPAAEESTECGEFDLVFTRK